MKAAAEAPFGVVSIAALELRSGPDHRRELTSQLLLGEAVRRLRTARSGAWWQVESLADGYRGWIRTWGLAPMSPAGLEAWETLARGRIRALLVTARARRGAGAAVTPLYWNSRVGLGERSGRWRRLVLPSGQRPWIEAAAVAGPDEAPPALTERLAGLWGIPYLWGGRTPSGLDCSGFTQQVLSEQGWRLPRDAHDQWRTCAKVAGPARARRGDLVFFSAGGRRMGHVGIWLGDGVYAHARGTVGLGSLDASNPLCDKALKRQYRAIGRPVLRVGTGPAAGPVQKRA